MGTVLSHGEPCHTMARTDQLLRLLLVLISIAEIHGDELGAPISPEEIAAAMSDPTLIAASDAMYNTTDGPDFEGDIILTPEQQAQLLKGRSATTINDLWENQEIPYTIDSKIRDDKRLVIAKAIGDLQAKTCLKFVGRTTQEDYIHIIRSKSFCRSYVGRKGGKQTLELTSNCALRYGTVIHEFMHALGFWHEQSRYDRDDYVTIVWENILDKKEHNFDKHSRYWTTLLGQPYDYGSVMHYPAYAFSKNDKKTIVPKEDGVTIGQRDGMSELDVKGINKLYKCEGADCKTWKKCQSKGGKCQSKAATCEGRTITTGCDSEAGCVCCITVSCEDKSKFCANMAAKGKCKKKSVKKKCPKSCGRC